jgi:sugar phosphate isomerase/epimerase
MFLEYGMNPEIGVDARALDTTSDKAFAQVAEILKGNHRSITVHGPFMDLVPGGVDPMLLTATRKRLDRFFEIIPIFNPVNVVCHTGYDPSHYRELWTEWISASVDTWKPHVARAERFGFKLLLENVYEKSPQVHSALFEAIPSDSFGFCLDVGHHNVFADGSLEKWIDTFNEKIMEVHLHDNDGEADTHWAIGAGNVDFEGLFQRMRNNGLKPTLTLEPHEEETLWKSLSSEVLRDHFNTAPRQV